MEMLGKLLMFRDIVELGTLSAAAKRWEISHSTMSRHLQSLEKELGVQLLRRTSRVMELTEEGRLVLGYSHRIGRDAEEMRQRLGTLQGSIRGELRINSLVHVGRYFVQPMLSSFLSLYPQVRVTLVLDDGPVKVIQDGFDLAVRVGLPAEASLTVRKLADNPVCLAASPGFVERFGQPSHPSELSRFLAVTYANFDRHIDTWAYLEDGEVRTIQVQSACRLSDGNAFWQAVLDGIGIGYLSAFAAEPEIRAGRLLKVLPRFSLPPYEPIYLIAPTTPYRSPKVEAFKQHLLSSQARAR